MLICEYIQAVFSIDEGLNYSITIFSTVLHLCVKYNQLEALKLLVESVSDEGEFLNSKGHEDGNTILYLAVMLKQIKVGVFYIFLVCVWKLSCYLLTLISFCISDDFRTS